MSASSTGLSEKTAIFIAYLFGWLSGLIIFLIEKDNDEVKFHAAQSIVVFGGLTVINIISPFIPVIGPLIISLVSLLWLLLWVGMLITAFMGKPPRLPIAAQYAEQLLKKQPRIESQ